MKKKESKIELVIEVELLTLLIYFLILSMLLPAFYVMVDFVLSFLLIDMFYVRLKNTKSKSSYVYLIVGIILLVTAIIEYVR